MSEKNGQAPKTVDEQQSQSAQIKSISRLARQLMETMDKTQDGAKLSINADDKVKFSGEMKNGQFVPDESSKGLTSMQADKLKTELKQAKSEITGPEQTSGFGIKVDGVAVYNSEKGQIKQNSVPEESRAELPKPQQSIFATPESVDSLQKSSSKGYTLPKDMAAIRPPNRMMRVLSSVSQFVTSPVRRMMVQHNFNQDFNNVQAFAEAKALLQTMKPGQGEREWVGRAYRISQTKDSFSVTDSNGKMMVSYKDGELKGTAKAQDINNIRQIRDLTTQYNQEAQSTQAPNQQKQQMEA